MTARPRSWPALLVSFAVAVLTLIPYLLANRLLASQEVFGGFLINPWDGYSYLAKMRQGLEGAWAFRLPYAPDPGPGAYLFLYYLFLGHIARWLGQPPIAIYHGARFIAAVFAFGLAWQFFDAVLPQRDEKRLAYGLTLLGSGLGWMVLPFGIIASDLLIPESIPFLSAYSNAHFPLALALEAAGALLVLRGKSGWELAGAVLCGSLLALVLPFAAITLVAFLVVWLVWEEALARRTPEASPEIAPLRRAWNATLLLAGGAAPWLVYFLWQSEFHPVLKTWTEQNETPSPPPLEFGLGLGLVLVMAVTGAWLGRAHATRQGRLLLAWSAVNLGLLYVPFSLQRRFALGLFLPLTALAAIGLLALARRGRWRILVPVALALSLPSNLVVVGAGLASVSRGDEHLVLTADELSAYRWLEREAAEGSLVLASPITGNRLPAYAPVRVLYGHPFETPESASARQRVVSLFQEVGPPEHGVSSLRTQEVDYVLYGPRERELGLPTWLEGLPVVFRSGEVVIYTIR